MDERVVFILIFIGSVFVSSVSQLMLKKSAMKEHKSTAAQYLNLLVIGAYLLFFSATLVTIFAFKQVPLSMGPVLEALGYVFVGILSFLVLKERVSSRVFIGMCLIILGVCVCTI